MELSAIRHPKKSKFYQIHTWQLDFCLGNHFYALFLSYIEDLFNQYLNYGDRKTKGWMLLDLVDCSSCLQISSDAVAEAIQFMSSKGILKLVPPRGLVCQDKSKMYIYLDALKLNQHIDALSKKNQEKLDLIEFSPYISLFCLISKMNVKQERTIKLDPKYKETAEYVFKFWKIVSDKPKSQLSDKITKMISDRLKEGYRIIDLLQASIGIQFSEHHKGIKTGIRYDGVKYVFGDPEKVDRFQALAEVNGYDENKVSLVDQEINKGIFKGIDSSNNLDLV